MASGHTVRQINVAELDFPLLQSKNEFDHGAPCEAIRNAQNDIRWADHCVVIYPLWLGAMPALLKGFFEQVFRPGFAISEEDSGTRFEKLMKGKSARIIVTMGMPAVVYRWFFKAHSVKNLKRNILTFCGFGPVKTSLIGNVHENNEDHLHLAVCKVAHLGNIAQ